MTEDEKPTTTSPLDIEYPRELEARAGQIGLDGYDIAFLAEALGVDLDAALAYAKDHFLIKENPPEAAEWFARNIFHPGVNFDLWPLDGIDWEEESEYLYQLDDYFEVAFCWYSRPGKGVVK